MIRSRFVFLCLIAVLTLLLIAPFAAAQEPAEKTIVETAIDEGNFTSLVAALELTGLDMVLEDENATFTVFAPTDDAFALIPEEDLDALLNDTVALKEVLLYHVVEGVFMQSDLEMEENITTLLGEDLAINSSEDELMINDALVIVADVEASNGVIHVIDAVLIPPEVPAENMTEEMTETETEEMTEEETEEMTETETESTPEETAPVSVAQQEEGEAVESPPEEPGTAETPLMYAPLLAIGILFVLRLRKR